VAKKDKTDKVDKKELEEAVKALKLEVRDDQIKDCMEIMNLFTSCGIAASLVEIEERTVNSLALAISMSEFEALKPILVKHMITMEDTPSND
jgi:hypothetical protein